MTLRRSGPAPHWLQHSEDQALHLACAAGPGGVGIEDLTLGTGKWLGWPAPCLGKVGELGLVALFQESWWADKLSFHPSLGPGLWIGPPQHLPYL